MKNTAFALRWRFLLGGIMSLLIVAGTSVNTVSGQGLSFDPLAPGAAPRAPAPTAPQAKPGSATPSAPVTAAKPVAKPDPKAAGSGKSKKDNEDLKPRLEKVVTKDNQTLQIGYFPSDKGVKAVPVMLVHEWTGKMNPYFGLAEKLQSIGCAVALINIRGHGLSQIKDADGKPIEVERATKQDMQMVIKYDMEAVKKFLREENDARKLNLNALVVIGVKEGALLAMNWSVMDWSWPSLPSKKQGQDVRALVLVSPVKSVNGIIGTAPQHSIVGRLPVMIVSGANATDTAEANRLGKLFEKARVTSKFNSAVPFPMEPLRIRTQLSSAELVYRGPGVVDGIAKFVKQNVVDKVETFTWVARNED